MKVFHGRTEGARSEQRTATFTGVVWADPIVPSTNDASMINVSFSPGARTYWHSHGIGQILQVTSGQGWICVEGGQPEPIRQGDVVWIGPHERHWHGASADSFMVHTATSLGQTMWQEEVAEVDYPRALGV